MQQNLQMCAKLILKPTFSAHQINLQLQFINNHMFFGKILKEGQTYAFNTTQAEETQGEVLSITNVVLAPTSPAAASLYIKKDSEEFLIANLTKDKPHASLNVFISLLDEVSLVVKGNGTLHITGFFEPDQQGDFLQNGNLPSDQEEEEEEEEESEQKVPVKPTQPVKQNIPAVKNATSPQQKPLSPAQKPASKPATQAAQKAPEPQEDDEDLEDDEELSQDLQDDEDLDDDLEDEEEQKPTQKPQQATGKPQQNQNQGQKPQFNNNNKGGQQQGGNKNWQNKGQQGGNNNWKNNNGNQQGGNKNWHNKGQQGGNNNWKNNNNKGGKPFNKGGKPFNKN